MHAGPGHPTETTIVGWLLSHLPQLSDINGPDQPGLVHRLDLDTSGIFICAHDNPTHLAVQAQISDGQLIRKYIAWVVGQCAGGTWIDTIERSGRQKMRAHSTNPLDTIGATYNKTTASQPTNRRTQHPGSITPVRNFTKHASMLVTPYASYTDSTIILCQLRSGIQHQIRCQTSSRGHPIFGDPIYGRRNTNPASAQYGLLLHAHSLEFNDPWSNQRAHITHLPPWIQSHQTLNLPTCPS